MSEQYCKRHHLDDRFVNWLFRDDVICEIVGRFAVDPKNVFPQCRLDGDCILPRHLLQGIIVRQKGKPVVVDRAFDVRFVGRRVPVLCDRPSCHVGRGYVEQIEPVFGHHLFGDFPERTGDAVPSDFRHCRLHRCVIYHQAVFFHRFGAIYGRFGFRGVCGGGIHVLAGARR